MRLTRLVFLCACSPSFCMFFSGYNGFPLLFKDICVRLTGNSKGKKVLKVYTMKGCIHALESGCCTKNVLKCISESTFHQAIKWHYTINGLQAGQFSTWTIKP